MCEVAPNTVLQWLGEAAEQLHALSRHVLHDGRVRQVQLDALFALRSAVKDGEVSAAAASERSRRSLALAQRLVQPVGQVVAPDCAPLFRTEGFRASMTALLTHEGHWGQLPRRQAPGPAPKPRGRPLPQLRYAQVVQPVRRRRLVRVTPRGVFGALEVLQQVLATCGWQINTAFGERITLNLRQQVAAVGWRVTTLCKGEAGLRQQLTL